jgi:hypothetical protein
MEGKQTTINALKNSLSWQYWGCIAVFDWFVSWVNWHFYSNISSDDEYLHPIDYMPRCISNICRLRVEWTYSNMIARTIRFDWFLVLRCFVFVSYLHVTGETYGRPISGQREVSGYSSMNDNNYWTVAEGIFIKPTEGLESRLIDRDEL